MKSKIADNEEEKQKINKEINEINFSVKEMIQAFDYSIKKSGLRGGESSSDSDSIDELLGSEDISSSDNF